MMYEADQLWEQIGITCDAWEALDRLSRTPTPVRFVENQCARQSAEKHYLDHAARLGATLVAWIQRGGTLELLSPQPLDTPAITRADAPLTPATSARIAPDLSPAAPAQPEPEPEADSKPAAEPEAEAEPAAEPEAEAEPEPEAEPELDVEAEPKVEVELEVEIEVESKVDVEVSEAPEVEPLPFTPAKILERPPVLTPARLNALKEKLSDGLTDEAPTLAPLITQEYHDELIATLLPAILGELGPPTPIKTTGEARRELGVLKKVLDEESLKNRWSPLPNDLVKRLAEAVVARARAFQDATPSLITWCDPKTEVHTLFTRLNLFIQEGQRAYVHGLALAHTPKHRVTWLDEATLLYEQVKQIRDQITPARLRPDAASRNPLQVMQAHRGFNAERELKELEHLLLNAATVQQVRAQLKKMLKHGMKQDKRLHKLILPYNGLLENQPGFSDLRRALRILQSPEELATQTATTPARIDPDWEHLPFIQGKRVLMVGGQPQEHSRLKIAEYFSPADLKWVELSSDSKMRQVQKHCKRIQNKNVDLVLVVQRFITHKASEMLHECCKKSNVPIAYIEQGYGVEQVKLGIENKLDLGRLDDASAGDVSEV